MQESIMSQKNSIIGAVIAVLFLGGGYYAYSTFFSESSNDAKASLNVALFNKDVVDFLNAKSKIDFKDTSFVNSTYYKQLVDYSEDIPRTTEHSRPNPFIPYAPTGPSR